MENVFRGKSVLVTGGTGSIGSEIVRRLLGYDPKVIRIYSRGEASQFDLQYELKGHANLRYLIGDVRDKERLGRAMQDIDIVFHAAALKHVPSCEYNPFEAVKTNVLGTQNVIDVSLDEGVEKVIAISTDKAASPSNVMGATKLLAERLVAASHSYRGEGTFFSCVRFGNVLGSKGSVVPLFAKQIRSGGPVTVTDPSMTRFMMTIPQAIDLVIEAAERAHGGEVFIFKMPSLRLVDLAEVMIEEMSPLYGFDPEEIEIAVIGARPGEKRYEELLTEEEASAAYETESMYILNGKGRDLPKATPLAGRRYLSNETRLLSKEEIRRLLIEGGFIEKASSAKQASPQPEAAFVV